MKKGPDSIGEKALVLLDKEIVIRDNHDLERVNELWEELNELRKKIKAGYQDIIDANYKAWKLANAKKAFYLDPVEKYMKTLRAKKAEYLELKAREKDEEEARLFAEAVKKTEGEDDPMPVAPVILPNDIPTGGPVLRKIWDFEIVDFDELIQAVADKRYSSVALLPNEKHLREQANSFKEHFKIPGVRSYMKVV